MTITQQLASQGYSQIPARRSPVGHLEIDASVDGHKAHLLVDTGASGTVVDLESARRWRLDLSEQGGAGCGIGISGPAHTAEITQLKLAHLTLRNVKVAVLDLSRINAGLENQAATRIDGILGADLLFSREAIIEVAPGILHLLNDPETRLNI